MLELSKRALLVLIAVSVVACATPQDSPSPTEDAGAAFHSLLDEAWEFEMSESPLFATATGDRRADDRLDSVTEADQNRRAEARRGFLERFEAMDAEALSESDRISHAIAVRQLRNGLEEHRFLAHRIPITNREGFHINFARMPDGGRFASVKDYENYISRLRAYPEYSAQHVELLRLGIGSGHVLPRVVLDGYEETITTHLVDTAEESVFFAPFARFPAAVAEGERERLTEAGRAAILESVIPAYRDFHTFMVEEYLPACRPTLGASELPDGPAYYAHRVKSLTTLDVTPEEVHQIGLDEVARIRAEMQEVIDGVGFTGSFADFLTFLREDPRFYAETPEELMETAALISKRMDGELPTLFNFLPRMPYGLKEIPAFIAPKTTAAYYGQPAGDGSRAGTYFLNTHNLPSRPLYALEALSLHEAVPGHHLQLALQQELQDLPEFRRFYGVTAFVEGWALYSERLGLEVGFYEDPYSNFGRLTYEMWRACRLVVDTGIHALGWSRDKAIDFLASNTALSLHEVTTEIDRYIAWPGQALAYKMGEIKIRELRARAEEELGERFDLREFHRILLANGSVPLDVLDSLVSRWIAEVQEAA